MSAALAELRTALGEDAVLDGAAVRPYLTDDTESRRLGGEAAAVLLPANAAEVATAMAWSYENGVALTPQGGRTGYAGGAVPLGGVALSLERLRSVRSFDPLLWRAEIEAGLPTADVRRLARESGLSFPPDPGAAEQSQIGGNAATNAGGPHAFKYGPTGAWVTGIEVVLPPGEIVEIGGMLRKDVAGYDLKSLLIGSEGTLGIITAVRLRLMPTPEAALPSIACYADTDSAVEAVVACLASGIIPAALEYLDDGTLAFARATYPGELPSRAGFLVIAEADGSPTEAEHGRACLREVLAPNALAVEEPRERGEIAALWRWRDGIGLAAAARRGGKVSEDVVVPLDRLAEAVDGTAVIASRHQVDCCGWGHAGDGNLHSTFLFAPEDPDERSRALAAAEEMNAFALSLGGSVSGEHGVGMTKTAHLRDQFSVASLDLQRAVKQIFDPRGLLNPGKKLG